MATPQELIDIDPMAAQSAMDLLAQSIGPDLMTDEELSIYGGSGLGIATDFGGDHYENLANILPQRYLDSLSSDVIHSVDSDRESRREWEQKEARGMRFLGISTRTLGGAKFPGASRVVHPLLVESLTQFNARAIAELWPPSGPVKTDILGAISQQVIDQGVRVQDYMNFLYTKKMPGGFEEVDRLLFRLPLSGSCFKKAYFDPLEQCIVSRFVEPAHFIVPYEACDLRSAQRLTHVVYEAHNDVIKKLNSGYYVGDASGGYDEVDADDLIDQEIKMTEGRTANTGYGDSERHKHYEVHLNLDIPYPGFQDLDRMGTPTGIGLPYILVVDAETQVVRRLQRNWRPGDLNKRRADCFIHYKFMPGFGFYGYGLLHLIGGLAEAATGALRAFMDSAHFAVLQGGYVSRDLKIKKGDVPISPGEWRTAECSAEELAKGFFGVPYKEPSQSLFQLIQYLTELGQRFAGTTEQTVGDGNTAAPMGTTLALIEQGSKTFTAIHKRLHEAQSQEFRIVAELCRDYLAPEGYPYAVSGASKYVMPTDFDDRIDVIPVSDPMIVSNTQRITQAQVILDTAIKYPHIVDPRKAIEYMFKVARINDYKEFMTDESQPSPVEQAGILDMQQKQAETDKLSAEAERLRADAAKLEAQRISETLKGQFTALQTAGAFAQQPTLAVPADALYSAAAASANERQIPIQSGGISTPQEAEPPIGYESTLQQPLGQGFEAPDQPEAPLPIQPETGAVGANRGILTEQFENPM